MIDNMKFKALTLALLILNFHTASQGQTVLNDFTVDPGTYYPSGSPFVADKIVGNYSQVSTYETDGSFSVALRWNAGQFVSNDGVDAISAAVTGLGFAYDPYAILSLKGQWLDVAGTAQLEFTSGDISL